MEVAEGTLVFVCRECNHSFFNNDEAVQHLNDHHPGDKPSINGYFNSFNKIGTYVIRNKDNERSLAEECTSDNTVTTDYPPLHNSEPEDHDEELERNWTNEMTVRLINKIKKFDSVFDRSPMKKTIWIKLTNEFNQENSKNLTYQQIENKWKTLKRTYKNVLKHNNTSGKSCRQWPFYNLVHDILFKKPEIVAPATCSSNNGLIIRNETDNSMRDRQTEDTNGEDSDVETAATQTESDAANRSFIKKRKLKENAAERRHKEKMQRFDTFNELLAKLVDKL
ncbi:hypothetical protein ILUMI_09775 [Ignelater luminosus]|uniref:C2H2-type domain-containing protein n=1 Tax=Ignelater luminosus TaxID=2038154 RepID=A0A8K0CZC8_IGNLU|nr:hypothetical protein ILUMI_09775 [Ignelater luminosus]